MADEKYARAAKFLQEKLSKEDFAWLSALMKDDAGVELADDLELSDPLKDKRASGDLASDSKRRQSPAQAAAFAKRFPNSNRLV